MSERSALTRLTGNGNGECGEKDCPNVYRTATGSFVVQGDVSDAFTPPTGEGLLSSPLMLPTTAPDARWDPSRSRFLTSKSCKQVFGFGKTCWDPRQILL